MIGLPVVKVAFVVQSERMTYLHGSKFAPTSRVSMRVYPKLTVPKFSAAVTEVAKDGTLIRPVILWKSR